MKNILCVDLEDWYHANLASGVDKNTAERRVVDNVKTLLSVFKNAEVKATFFVLGKVAEEFPELVKEIDEEGHEIASHGYSHQLVYTQTEEEFRKDILDCKKLLEDIINKPVVSYRAPSWSIREDSFWALQILQEAGYKNDSSIFPFKNFLYGVAHAPRFAYSTKQYNNNSCLSEYPPSTIRLFGLNCPFSGGFYFRALPLWFIQLCIRHLNQEGHSAVMYIHPWEIDDNTPKIPLCLRDSIIQYWGIRHCKEKLIKLVSKFKFDTLTSVKKEKTNENFNSNTGL